MLSNLPLVKDILVILVTVILLALDAEEPDVTGEDKKKKAVAKIGIVRFNPFGEMGGNQSFSVALLNSEDSGIVITSHYGKDIQRLYAKPITNGKPEYSLSAEEQEAIKKACLPLGKLKGKT